MDCEHNHFDPTELELSGAGSISVTTRRRPWVSPRTARDLLPALLGHWVGRGTDDRTQGGAPRIGKRGTAHAAR